MFKQFVAAVASVILLTGAISLLGSTIVRPNSTPAEHKWEYLETLGIIQKGDVIIYLTDKTEDEPWFFAQVLDVDKKDGSILVMRSIGSGVSIFEKVDKTRILSAARPRKPLKIFGD